MEKLINGNEISKKIRDEIAQEIIQLKKDGVTPGLTVILVGEDPASKVYVGRKEKISQELGISSNIVRLPAETTEEILLSEIEKLNNEVCVHGILVQLPLPKHINETKVIEAINPSKDVDGFHPINIGKLVANQETFIPCTPFGILQLLKHSKVEISGKNAVVVGRSNIVGTPVGQLLLNENATVTYIHSKTVDPSEHLKKADIVIVAVGIPKFLKATDLKPGVVVIDVGINRLSDGTLCGDVDFKTVEKVASKITPVPGGVGPMTIAMLMKNTVMATKKSRR